ncbi:MAG: hypothetical protein GY904_08745 [Planctomycetaceae bacterium]|nr:hypothetical protein [Planctomycetaceae bacterium]
MSDFFDGKESECDSFSFPFFYGFAVDPQPGIASKHEAGAGRLGCHLACQATEAAPLLFTWIPFLNRAGSLSLQHGGSDHCLMSRGEPLVSW